MKFIGYLFHCSSNRKAVAIRKDGNLYRLRVQDEQGFELPDFMRFAVSCDELNNWLAEVLGDAMIKSSYEQLDAVIEALKK